MGLIDFVKSAGAKLFGREEEPETPTQTPEEAAAAAEKIAAARRAALRSAIAQHGIEVKNLGIALNDDVATVSGTVESQELREKTVLIVGNTNGIARVDDQITVDEPEPEATFYTVVSGDTLSKIAKEHYGNAMKYPVIFEANKPMLSDPDKIYPGQVLRIPPIEE